MLCQGIVNWWNNFPCWLSNALKNGRLNQSQVECESNTHIFDGKAVYLFRHMHLSFLRIQIGLTFHSVSYCLFHCGRFYKWILLKKKYNNLLLLLNHLEQFDFFKDTFDVHSCFFLSVVFRMFVFTIYFVVLSLLFFAYCARARSLSHSLTIFPAVWTVYPIAN